MFHLLRWFSLFCGATLRIFLYSRRALVLENLALRQQLAVVMQRERHVRLTPMDRLLWVGLRGTWRRWPRVLVIVKPKTVVAWHRAAFRGYWRLVSRRTGRPRARGELRKLIGRMATENHWGAPRIHGELVKLGFWVSERTVSRYLPKRRDGGGRRGENWAVFLRNHPEVLAAMDFLVVPTATFRLLYVLVILHHGRRQVLHVNLTEHPTAAWVSRQLREAFPNDTAPRYLLLDHDAIFSKQVTDMARAMGITPVRTAFRSPWQNGIRERFLGSVRRELLDHVIVLGERHLRRLLSEYVAYYNQDRCHLSLGKDAPDRRQVSRRPSPGAKVVALPRVGGLHHRYEHVPRSFSDGGWRQAA